MDDVVRNRRLLLRGTLAFALLVAACSPARGEPVGVSQGGKDDPLLRDAGGPTNRSPLAGLPPDYQTKLHPVAHVAKSEHLGGAPAIVWADDEGQAALVRGSAPPANALFVEEILGPKTADGGSTTLAIYLLAIEGGSPRFGAGDAHALTTLDDDAGTSLCARCHAEAPRAPLWITR